MKIASWVMRAVGEPQVRHDRVAEPGPRECVVRVAGCGVCHTDLGFYYDGVPTKGPLPLTLGHEVSGTIVAAGEQARDWLGQSVVVPAVIPCGVCPACRAGHGRVCPEQVFPGSSVHGGFASHVVVPARGLCPVPDLSDRSINPHGLDLALLSVIADAVSTPYQAIVLSGLRKGDLAVFIGVGGVGGFGVQAAAALGARVVAIDVAPEKLDAMAAHGAQLTLRADQLEFKALRDALRAFAERFEIPTWRQKIFETSGTEQGQATALGLLGPGGYLGVVGFTAKKIETRLSNLMAFDATARGNWGCLPEHYPDLVDMALAGRIALEPFVERRPLASINETFQDIHARRTTRRVILVPEN